MSDTPEAMMVDDPVSAQSSLPFPTLIPRSTQKGQKKADYGLWCFIKGDSVAINVTVPADAKGWQLRESIWQKRKGKFERDHIDAADLEFFKVGTFWTPFLSLQLKLSLQVNEKIPVDPIRDLADRVSLKLRDPASTTELGAVTILEEVFTEILDEKYLHVFVNLPSWGECEWLSGLYVADRSS
jgi:hypothetical protein